MAASLATGLAGTIPALVAARGLVGAGQALFVPAAISWIVAEGDRVDARATGLAAFTATSSLGRSAGLLLIGLALAAVGWLGVAAPAGWRWAFALTALPNLVLLALVLRPRAWGALSPAPVEPLQATGWARPVFLLLALLPIMVVQALAGWLPTLFVLDRAMTPPVAASWIGALTLVGGAGGQLLAGWLLVRLPAWQGAVPLVIVGAMMAALPCLLVVGWAPGAVTATAGVLLADLALGLAIFAGLFGWQRLVPPSRRVTGNGLFFAVITIAGAGLGPLLTGIVADHGPALRAALMTMALGCTALAALVAPVAQPLYRRHGLA